MKNIRTMAVLKLSAQTDNLNNEIKNKLTGILGEEVGNEIYEVCEIYYEMYNKDNILLETVDLDENYRRYVIDRRGNNYDNLCYKLLKHLNVKDSEYIVKKYMKIADNQVLIKKICSKNRFLSHILAKQVLKEAENNNKIEELQL